MTLAHVVAWLMIFIALPAAAGMGEDDARHLLLRTGWGATPAQITAFSHLGRAAAVDRLLDGIRSEARTPAPGDLAEVSAFRRRPADMNEEEKRAFLREQMRQGMALRAWWMQEMQTSDSPLTEKLTLFWHNHFVSSLQKVKLAKPMLEQNHLLREHALGNFGELLHAIARDPAMVIYLDSARNRRDAPNENFAREVMELFTLGEGHYTETDIREAARAFTGWSLDRTTGAFRFYPRLHDDGEKTVLGKTGRLNGDDVLDLLLAHPATAEHLTRKLWREFISDTPNEAEVQRLGRVLRQNRYAMRPWLRALLLAPDFWAAQNRGGLVKSPVEFLLGLTQGLNVTGAEPQVLALASRQLGQDLFAPPNVKGWPGGTRWIDTTSLLARRQMAERLFRAQDAGIRADSDARKPVVGAKNRMEQRAEQGMARFSVDAEALFETLDGNESQRRSRLASGMLAIPPADALPENGNRHTFLQALVQDAAYQLK